jgi:DNA-binding SARP family transcriptional activator
VSVSASAVRPSPLRLSLLGGFELRKGDGVISLPLSAQRLVAYLAIHGRPLSREHVSGTLWGEFSSGRSAANLRGAIWRANRSGHPLVQGREQLHLNDEVQVDLRDFLAKARALLHDTPSSDAPATANDFGEMWTSGDLLPDWYDEWLTPEREQLHQLRLQALEALCRRLTAASKFGEAVSAGLAAVAADPLRESAHRAVIEAHLAQGNVADAVHQYRTYRALLGDELGLAPTSQMELLIRGLRYRDDAAVTPKRRDGASGKSVRRQNLRV